MIDIDEAIERRLNLTQRLVSQWEKSRAQALEVNELVEKFNEAAPEELGVSAESSDFWGSVDFRIRVFLGKHNILSQVKPLLGSIVKTRRYSPARRRDSLGETPYVLWTFPPLNNLEEVPLEVIAYLGESVACRKVPTGKMIPEMKIECSPVSKEENIGEEV